MKSLKKENKRLKRIGADLQIIQNIRSENVIF